MGMRNSSSVTEFILVGLTSHRKTQLLLFVLILIMYLVTIAGNLVIIILVQVDSRLHTPMYFFLTHLSCLEIILVSCIIPQMLAHLLAGKGNISFMRCAAQMYIGTCLACSESFLLGAMAYDRYLAICCPLLYAVIMHRERQIQLISACWTSGFFLASIDVGFTLCLPYCGPNHINHFACELPMLLKLACTNTHVAERIIFCVATLVLLVPFAVILVSYMLILSSVLRMQSGWRKAFSTCASHLTVVTLFYGTAIVMYVFPRSKSAPDRDKKMAVFYLVITPLLNPVIYTLRNKDVHGAVAKVLWKRGFE